MSERLIKLNRFVVEVDRDREGKSNKPLPSQYFKWHWLTYTLKCQESDKPGATYRSVDCRTPLSELTFGSSQSKQNKRGIIDIGLNIEYNKE